MPIKEQLVFVIANGSKGNHPPVPTSQIELHSLKVRIEFTSKLSRICLTKTPSSSLIAERLMSLLVSKNMCISGFQFCGIFMVSFEINILSYIRKSFVFSNLVLHHLF